MQYWCNSRTLNLFQRGEIFHFSTDLVNFCMKTAADYNFNVLNRILAWFTCLMP